MDLKCDFWQAGHKRCFESFFFGGGGDLKDPRTFRVSKVLGLRRCGRSRHVAVFREMAGSHNQACEVKP